MKCPYCGAERGFSEPQPVCRGMPEGIRVPLIQQCETCDATLSPDAFQPGTRAFAEAKMRKYH
jgi:hypothetical protein